MIHRYVKLDPGNPTSVWRCEGCGHYGTERYALLGNQTDDCEGDETSFGNVMPSEPVKPTCECGALFIGYRTKMGHSRWCPYDP